MASTAYARATLLHLLGVTFLPFSMLAVSRYDLAAAVWIYGANMIWFAVTALAISRVAERASGRAREPSGRVKLGILILSAVLSMIASLYSPRLRHLPHRAWPASSIDARRSSFNASPRDRARTCQIAVPPEPALGLDPREGRWRAEKRNLRERLGRLSARHMRSSSEAVAHQKNTRVATKLSRMLICDVSAPGPA